MKSVNSESLLAAIMLAFLATAGLFYVNLGGAFLSAFVDGLGISRQDAGYITAANKYGAAFGALIATFGIRYFQWKKTAYIILPLMIAVDVLSFQITDANLLKYIRFGHGTIGGFLVGIGLGVIARTNDPDKGYGMLLVVQYTFGSLGIYFVPKLVSSFGHGAAFGALICFSLITLMMVPFIPDYKVKSEQEAIAGSGTNKGLIIFPLVLAMLSIFMFQASNMGIADYAIELGKENGYEVSAISDWLSLANIISVSGAVLVFVIGSKYGRFKPLLIGLTLQAIFTYAFHWSEDPKIYFIANTVTGIGWAFVIPYLLGLLASFDGHGQMGALAGFISKLGLASGPMVAAYLVGENDFSAIINTASVGLAICAVAVFIPALKVDHTTKVNNSNSKELDGEKTA
ncbi:MFS transporter [Temperatibacter marinus]|uniref:MFS transporter n=1 Tax=Temperatibacter marinus TaxID=1456591 RepID=A0AA52H9A4_9PROT|nr:MFS transporter [Temperatibacter marinus]WND02976.1 MFS transporter [Temperatibacter marinus]